jgi:hypothetical protein
MDGWMDGWMDEIETFFLIKPSLCAFVMANNNFPPLNGGGSRRREAGIEGLLSTPVVSS